MRFLLLSVMLIFACSASRPLEDKKGPCKHSCFTAITMEPALNDSAVSSLLTFKVNPPGVAAYRVIGNGKETDRSGVTDSLGNAIVWINPQYRGEYFVEVKAPGLEPLMLESMRAKITSYYTLTVCLAKGSQLQRYKYLGENKNNNGVLESLN
jgi:hypothetical protein